MRIVVLERDEHELNGFFVEALRHCHIFGMRKNTVVKMTVEKLSVMGKLFVKQPGDTVIYELRLYKFGIGNQIYAVRRNLVKRLRGAGAQGCGKG